MNYLSEGVLLTHPLHPHHRLDMMGMGEHIDRDNIGDPIFWQFFSFLIPHLSDEELEIASECRGIAGDVDDLTSTEGDDIREG